MIAKTAPFLAENHSILRQSYSQHRYDLRPKKKKEEPNN